MACGTIRAMKKGIDNPFIISGYVSPEYFCDRKEETERLIDAMVNGRNVTMIAPRRMGKTGLIKNAFYRLKAEGGWNPIYVDVYSCQNQVDFAKRMAETIIGSMDSTVEKALKAAAKFFKSLRPSVSIDPITGSPTYSLGVERSESEVTLRECFEYLGSRSSRCIVAIDEFQQVASFREKGLEALLRSLIQFVPNVRFIFAGSKRHMIADMFSSPARPFYNSTQMFPLDVIQSDAYFRFARRHMKSRGVSLERDVFDFIYGRFDGITWYVQTILNRLYGFRSARLDDVSKVVQSILDENTYNFGNILENLPLGSVRLLRAIAQEGAVKAVNAGSFIARHRLRATSSVNASLSKLLQTGLVDKTERGYLVEDRFFSLWLARQ